MALAVESYQRCVCARGELHKVQREQMLTEHETRTQKRRGLWCCSGSRWVPYRLQRVQWFPTDSQRVFGCCGPLTSRCGRRQSVVARAARHGLEAEGAAGRRRRRRKRAINARAAETRDINIGGGEGGKGFTYLRVGAGHEPGRRRRRARRESRSPRAAAPPNIARSRDVTE